jgi:hypothetical protein
MAKTNRTITLDIHDWSILHNRFDLLMTLKEHYPDMKLSLFTIPFDYAFEMGDLRVVKDEAIRKINANKDWLEFIPHGITHFPREFEKADKEVMTVFCNNIIPEMVKSGLPEDRIVKGFCAPMWLWNQDVIDVLNSNGWWGAVDRNQPFMLKTDRYYTYTHSIDEPFWLSNQEVINLHGHISPPSPNGLEDCVLKLLKMPVDAEWKFVSEYVKGN